MKKILSWALGAVLVSSFVVWAAQVAVLQTDTREEAWTKETLNNSDLQTNIDGKADALGADDNYVTDAEKVVIGNTSNTNSGDENLTPVDTGGADAAFYPVLLDGLTGTQAAETDNGISYNPSTNILTVTGGTEVPGTASGGQYSFWKEDSDFGSGFTGWGVYGNVTADTIYAIPLAAPAAGQVMVFAVPGNQTMSDGTTKSVSVGTWKTLDDGIAFVIDGGGSAITTGIKGDLEVVTAMTINSVTLLGDQSGSIVVDIWVDSYANFPPTDADSITASAVPTISTALKGQDETLTGWTLSLSKGDIIRYNVDSVTTLERVTISLKGN